MGVHCRGHRPGGRTHVAEPSQDRQRCQPNPVGEEYRLLDLGCVLGQQGDEPAAGSRFGSAGGRGQVEQVGVGGGQDLAVGETVILLHPLSL